MRQMPWRTDNQISQSFNDGVCRVYTQSDTAKPGYKPRPELEQKAFLRYEEQRTGLNRYYTARQVDVDVQRVLRVPKGPPEKVPTPQDVIRTEDGKYFRIDFVQTVPGVRPPCLDLTLVKFEQNAGGEKNAVV